jgi:outer membrane lipoprotein-sorting protein
MKKRRNILLVIGGIVLLAAVVSGFVLLQPSVEDILVQTLESVEMIEDAHAVVTVNFDTVEEKGSATVEVWGRKSEDGPGAFRLEVLEASEEKAQGAVVVSDGENLWAYSPLENKVFVGTAEEAKELMADREPMHGDFDPADHEHPESAEEAVQMLLEYFTAEKSGTELVADQSAHLLKLEPIPDQMPAEYIAVGGYLNLWIDENRMLPLAVEYTGGSFGQINVTVTNLEINQGVDEARFTFEVPADAEVVRLADLAPQSLSLAEAQSAAEFELLTPAETPAGATLVDVLEVRGAIVQRYTLPDGGSFSVAQGLSDQARQPDTEKQTVEVRGVAGTLYTAEDGNQVILAWTEGELFYSIAGDLTADQALMVAESLQ